MRWEGGEMERRQSEERGPCSAELVHALQSLGYVNRCRDASRGREWSWVAGSEGLCVNAPVWGGGEFITYLLPWTFHL